MVRYKRSQGFSAINAKSEHSCSHSGDANKVIDFYFTAQKHFQYETSYQRDFLLFFLPGKRRNISCICSGSYPKSKATRNSVTPVPNHICSTQCFERNFAKYAEEKYIDFLGNHSSANFKKHLFPGFSPNMLNVQSCKVCISFCKYELLSITNVTIQFHVTMKMMHFQFYIHQIRFLSVNNMPCLYNSA